MQLNKIQETRMRNWREESQFKASENTSGRQTELFQKMDFIFKIFLLKKLYSVNDISRFIT